jgi:hypothetical protein
MSAHTPGPWRFTIGRMHPDAPAFGFSVYPEKDMPNLPTGIKQHSIASGNLYEHGAYEAFYKPAEIEANARLIAAAPEMHSDGAFLLDRLDDFEREIQDEELLREWAGHVSPAIARFRAALSRAKDQP